MDKKLLFAILSMLFIVTGFILALVAYACQSFTALVFGLAAFLCSAYYATALDDAKDNRKKS